MSKLICVCGHWIRDQTDELPYKARFVKDKQEHELFEKIEDEVKRLSEAIHNHDVEKWLGNDNSWANNDIASVLSGKIFSIYIKDSDEILECTQCGRLWLENPQSSFYVQYNPENKIYNSSLDTVRDSTEKSIVDIIVSKYDASK